MASDRSHFGKVAVLMGGISAERDVSLMSGRAIHQSLIELDIDAHVVDVNPSNIGDLLGQGFDRAFIALHGRWGEDGVIQGALEAVGLPYTGSGVLGCALAMDKVRSKQIWQSMSLPTADYRVIRNANDLHGVIEQLGLPLFLKPAKEGSSVGVGKVTCQDELLPAFEYATKSGDDVLAEKFLSGAELTVGILGKQALPVVRLAAANDFYDYDAKYLSNDTQYFCPAGLDTVLEKKVSQLALDSFSAVGCQHWGRVDIMLDGDDHPVLLEVNPIPGMTSHSLVPKAAQQAGLNFNALVLTILETTL